MSPEPAPVESAPSDFSTYERDYAYLTFDYPKGWSIGNDEELDGGQMLFVNGPNDAVVGFTIVPKSSTMTIDEYAKSVHNAHAKSFAERGISIGPVSATPAKARIGGVEVTGIEHRSILSPASESVPRLDQFFLVALDHKKLFISVQLSDEVLESVRPGLTRIYDTLRAPRK